MLSSSSSTSITSTESLRRRRVGTAVVCASACAGKSRLKTAAMEVWALVKFLPIARYISIIT